MTLNKPCLTCGALVEGASYCDKHMKPRPGGPRNARRTEREKARYRRGWKQLSKRARQMQPFCSVCQTKGTPDNPLTCEHLPQAVERLAEGLPVRLEDVDVLCLKHNSERRWERAAALAAHPIM